MTKHSEFFTATMAKVYASQGYLEKAANIYNYILEKAPHREDLKVAMQELKDRIKKVQVKEDGEIKTSVKQEDESGLTDLFEEWIVLLLRHDNILKLQKIHEQLMEDGNYKFQKTNSK